jgi:hypothetical protein
VKFTAHKDANGQKYYKSECKRMLIMRQGSKYWSLLRYNNTNNRPGYIDNGYLEIDFGLLLNEAKQYAERYMR